MVYVCSSQSICSSQPNLPHPPSNHKDTWLLTLSQSTRGFWHSANQHEPQRRLASTNEPPPMIRSSMILSCISQLKQYPEQVAAVLRTGFSEPKKTKSGKWKMLSRTLCYWCQSVVLSKVPLSFGCWSLISLTLSSISQFEIHHSPVRIFPFVLGCEIFNLGTDLYDLSLVSDQIWSSSVKVFFSKLEYYSAWYKLEKIFPWKNYSSLSFQPIFIDNRVRLNNSVVRCLNLPGI